MKQCPSCKKEFPDSMRFCQTDGTPLVEAAEQAPPPDPYKTVVGGMIKMDDDLLQIPEQDDPMKTMVSPPKMDIPKAAELPKQQEEKPQETPRSSEQGNNPPPTNFGEQKQTPPANVSSSPTSGSEPPKKSEPAPPPKPFNETPKIDSSQKSDSPFGSPFTSKESDQSDSPFGKPPSFSGGSPFDKPTGSPGSSPFDKPSNAQQSSPFDKSPPPPYKEPEPFGAKQPPPFGGSPFDQPQTPFNQPKEPINEPFQQNEWTPPPAPVAGWQDQRLGSDTPFQPPAAGGQNNTLALVSLVLGILSFVCLGIFAGIPAIITGYMQRNNIQKNPAEYGGGGMAMAGMILGGINVVLTVVVFVIYAILIFANL